MATCHRSVVVRFWASLYVFLVASMVGALNVSYDQRAFVLNGQRRLLISAGIHYPRATPEMWPELIATAKRGGANVIQTYVFWSGHEPRKGEYNFEGRYDLPKFVELVGEAGMYLNLRIGPYVCAEWNFGGFPVWLRDIPGIEFRTDNKQFKDEMETFTKFIVEKMRARALFAQQGGPIIMAQIENEYGNIEWEYGQPGKQYVKWAANMAEGLDAGVPWIMCQQGDAPLNVINTCNGYYCDGFTPNAPGRPTMWTEDWNGWYQLWGGLVPHRPVQDNAFAVARFYQRGGTFQNYYMYFGGTNFERTSGGPFITTSYDYDAPIDEYGLVRQPKWGHLKDLHEVLMRCESALMSVDDEPEYISLGRNLEAHVYTTAAHPEICAAFLANIDSSSSAVVEFRGTKYELPAWSVSILPDCKTVAYNTAKIHAQTSLMTMKRNNLKTRNPKPADVDTLIESQVATIELDWEKQEEPIGIRGGNTITAHNLLEQINTTKDSSDYLWYTTRFQVSKEDIKELQGRKEDVRLVLEDVRDALHVFVNGELSGSFSGSWFSLNHSIKLKEGVNEIALLCMTMGIQNYGAFLEKDGAGIKGKVQVTGLGSGVLDLTTSEWVYQVGLKGEDLQFFFDSGPQKGSWVPATGGPSDKPLVWYKTKFSTPDGEEPVALDLASMGKGQVWVNGHHLGRYWPLLAPQGGCSGCDFRGPYNAHKCVTGCGEPSQRWYHVPRAWLQADENTLVLFEEVGGNPSLISVATRSPGTVCAHVSDSHPPLVDKWATSSSSFDAQSQRALVPHVRLECAVHQQISHIVFASFGSSSGTCGSYSEGDCHASSSRAVVEKACLGKTFCSLDVSPAEFGEDPCPLLAKTLTVQALCRGPSELTNENLSDDDIAVPLGMYDRKWQRYEVINQRTQQTQSFLSDI
ncbi:protein MpGH35.2 [Marchantia polymorpha subsp. ruderalis]|uniref:Beta-galactosidase n=1 Tax=Marchantia polymorpha TaxID=3197 RepID=A0A2R6WK50_MARPO|nr:hypothetical protein MARPO_0082s0063 [Marchantia polymorpha]BBN02477.1 hypothetical protein Mp_2g15660 [Marchantia polymorpha subsp. ruderalis]|eukprot:PTQ34224.1 hypothetical protein MARPO_0082s0063 [Marchantia polymorpha]